MYTIDLFIVHINNAPVYLFILPMTQRTDVYCIKEIVQLHEHVSCKCVRVVTLMERGYALGYDSYMIVCTVCM